MPRYKNSFVDMKNDTNLFSRRRFIKTTGLSAVAGVFSGFDLSAPKRSGMKMGLVTYLWGKDWDVPTLIANCSKAKVYGVELRVEHAHGMNPDTPAARRREVRSMFEDSKVTFVGMGTNQDYHHTDQDKLRQSIEGTKDYIRLSADLGGTGVKVKPNAFPEGVPREKTIEQIGRSLREVGAFGADYGQEIRLEVHGNETQELPNIRAMMEAADHPNVKVCWNCNMEDLNGQGLAYNFNLVKDYFGDTVHIREVNVGEYPYAELVRLFVGMDYQGWILLECRTEPDDKVEAMAEQRKLWLKMEKG